MKPVAHDIRINGYSLVEVLVAVALSTLVLGGVLLLVSGGSRSWRVIALQMQADQDVNTAMNRLVFGLPAENGLPSEKGIRCAAAATVTPGAAGDWSLSYAPGSVTGTINEITYDAAERRLLFEPGGRLVGRGIDFAWAGEDGRSLTITLRVSRTSGPLQAEAEAATYVLFRNLNR